MASVKVLPRHDKMNSEGKVPIYLRITKNRKSKYLALDVYIEPTHWNCETHRIKHGSTNSAQINAYLSSKVAEAERISLEMETKSLSVSAFDIKSKILGKTPARFFEFTITQEKVLSDEYTIGTFRRYKSVVEKIKNYCKNEAITFEDIDVKFIKDFQHYLSCTLKNHPNTIHSNLKVFRKIITDAVAEEILPAEKNPFNKIKLKAQKTSRLFLLDDEIEKLEKLSIEPDSKLNHHRNLYIFSAYSAGIRIGDLLMMRWKHFDGIHLIFQIRKTKEDLSIKLPQKSLDILSFYKILAERKGWIDPESFIFPLLSIHYSVTDKIKIHLSISSAESYTNKDLRKLGIMAHIEKKFSFHSARHSWAVRALQKGMRIEYVSKLMGHASVKQTEVYAQILNKELDIAMEIFNQ